MLRTCTALLRLSRVILPGFWLWLCSRRLLVSWLRSRCSSVEVGTAPWSCSRSIRKCTASGTLPRSLRGPISSVHQQPEMLHSNGNILKYILKNTYTYMYLHVILRFYINTNTINTLYWFIDICIYFLFCFLVFIYLLLYFSICFYLFIDWFSYLSIHLFIAISELIYLSILIFYLFIYLFIYLFLFMNLFIDLFYILLFVHFIN